MLAFSNQATCPGRRCPMLCAKGTANRECYLPAPLGRVLWRICSNPADVNGSIRSTSNYSDARKRKM